MSNRAKVNPLSAFDNPSEKDYTKAKELRPVFELDAEELLVWDFIAPWLSKNDRLKPYYKYSLIEYCRVIAELSAIARYFRENPDEEYYEITGRNGVQRKTDSRIPQRNELRRTMDRYVSRFGLDPAAEKQIGDVQMDFINEFGLHDVSTR